MGALERIFEQKLAPIADDPGSTVSGIIVGAGGRAGQEATSTYRRKFQARNCIGKASWRLTFEEFVECVQNTRDTAPGPDGIPFAAWRSEVPAFHRVLYDIYLHWLYGGDLIDNFNEAWLVFWQRVTIWRIPT